MFISGSPESEHTLVVGFVEWTEIALGCFVFQKEKASSFIAAASPQDLVYHGQEEGYDN